MTDTPFTRRPVTQVDPAKDRSQQLRDDVQIQSRPQTPSARADHAFAFRSGDRDDDRSFGALF
ncbi:hypothetical protein [uncultured Brevundimonas sp.]|uniref:hypothetical protein n=1 Tax=uncultured Brevundimonas sp. TaxID=213418 RepID=UPI0025F925D8|nr:hypothetical protein [uncultured Brevundimonas sp.]